MRFGLLLAVLLGLAWPAAVQSGACPTVGSWLDPKTGQSVPNDQMIAQLAEQRIVLLGESHDNPEHHRWQLHSLAALHGRRPALVVGFEMFPRSVQPALEAWSRGELAEDAFLKESRWHEVWGFDPALYLPLLHFARQTRSPTIALNVERDLVARVGQEGWHAIPADQRQGLSDPVPASPNYRESLAEVYLQAHRHGDEAPPDKAEVLESDDFARFVEAQLTWDRAMAEALATAAEDYPEALIVGIIGQGHLEQGYGVPRQLTDLGFDEVAVLLPMESAAACASLDPEVAEAIFVVDPQPDQPTAPAKPKLGVVIEAADQGLRILSVVEASIAETAELRPGDIIVTAAGLPVGQTAELIAVIGRQAPGTWLPLGISRDGEAHDIIAKFPAATDGAP